MSTKKWLASAALGVMIVIACSGFSARAEDDDDDLPDTKIFRSLLQSLGLRSSSDGIDYRERSPLVVPPGRDLPPPANASAAERNPAWPNDPDLKRKKEAKAKSKEPLYKGDSAVFDRIRPLRPSELEAKGPPGRAPTSASNERVIDNTAPMKPSELGYKGGLFSSMFSSKENEYATFTGEAPRTSLIEPPIGYRTPSPTQPYGLGKETYKPTSPTDRLTPTR